MKTLTEQFNVAVAPCSGFTTTAANVTTWWPGQRVAEQETAPKSKTALEWLDDRVESICATGRL